MSRSTTWTTWRSIARGNRAYQATVQWLLKEVQWNMQAPRDNVQLNWNPPRSRYERLCSRRWKWFATCYKHRFCASFWRLSTRALGSELRDSNVGENEYDEMPETEGLCDRCCYHYTPTRRLERRLSWHRAVLVFLITEFVSSQPTTSQRHLNNRYRGWERRDPDTQSFQIELEGY